MDDRGRLAQPLTRGQSPRGSAPVRGSGYLDALAPQIAWFDRNSLRLAKKVARFKPRYLGVIASFAIVLASATYGMVRGGHVETTMEALRDVRDAGANAAGFKIASLEITGRRQLSEAEVLALAGITDRTSLLFLSVDDAQRKLEASPWIAQATIRKFYPGHLDVTITERNAYAVWQHSGELHVIAADGTVLGPLGDRKITGLPLVVGPGAATRARAIVTALEAQPVLREQLRAAVLVAERRWNLKLKSGLDVRLPEADFERALETLVALDRDRRILSRDLTAIDLRVADRVTVRLSDEAAQAREQAAKDAKKKKGGPA